MSKVGESVLRGLRQAVAYSRGDSSQVRIHLVRVPKPPDVAAIRKRLKLTQTEFADRFGFRVATLRDWEQRRRSPVGPARVLLTLIAREPKAVLRALRAATPRIRKAG